jgi:hypothetical protein
MKGVGVLFALLLMSAPLLFAKGKTVRITIEGAGLEKAVEITDAKLLANFNVWAGPATSSNEAKSLIVDWAHGAITPPPASLPRYRVSFYTSLPNERVVYVVFYAYDPATKQGWVYLPGKADEFYRLNVSTIYHGVEGKWFHAWDRWEDVATPLIANSKISATTNSAQPRAAVPHEHR